MITGNKKAGENRNAFILGFQDIDRTKLLLAGGKGANLGELFRDRWKLQVPDGFCITTEAYKKVIENNRNLTACWMN
jgi:phosphoenolpyruvate synthase/pyruvate phosphate dikinase